MNYELALLYILNELPLLQFSLIYLKNSLTEFKENFKENVEEAKKNLRL
ncbi:MAG: hypothetical protein QXF76_02690 [Candidatus Anstonellales archaeon]